MISRFERKRLSVLVGLAVVSWLWLTYWLGGQRRVGGKLMEIVLETGLLDEGKGLLKWVDGKEKEGTEKGDGGIPKGFLQGTDEGGREGGVRLVVFGNSEIAMKNEKKGKKKWKNWVEGLCQELNCTSLLNFAPHETQTSTPPARSIISNSIYLSALTTHLQSQNVTSTPPPPALLDDLSTQIRTFLAQPPPSNPPDTTIFILNFGLWEIYHLASLDFEIAKNTTDLMTTELFTQLDILYSHYTENVSLVNRTQPSTPLQEENSITSDPPKQPLEPPQFTLILPELFDPTLLPGWPSRPPPPHPTNSAEELRHGVHLTDRWNKALQATMRTWAAPPKQSLLSDGSLIHSFLKWKVDSKDESKTEAENTLYIEKDVVFATITPYIMDSMVNTHMQQQGVSDGKGLGNGLPVFQSVYEPCVVDAVEGEKGGSREDGRSLVDGWWVCARPEDYLFWDGWTLGPVASEVFARGVKDLIMKQLKRIEGYDFVGV